MSENKTSVRLDDELLRSVKIACVQRDTTQTEAIIAGLKMWLSGGAAEDRIDAGLARKQRELVAGFVELLKADGGDDEEQREVASFAEKAVRLWLRMRRETALGSK